MYRSAVIVCTLLVLGCISGISFGQGETVDAAVETFSIDLPRCVLSGVPCDITVSALDAGGKRVESYTGHPEVSGVLIREDGGWTPLRRLGPFQQGVCTLKGIRPELSIITVRDDAAEGSHAVRIIPGLLSLVPPLVAIALALILRQVLLSLFCGVWIGAVFLAGYNPFTGFLRVLDHV